MNKAIIFAGKEGLNNETEETYQLLIKETYESHNVRREDIEDRKKYFECLSKIFSNKIVNAGLNLEVGILNGKKINVESHHLINIMDIEKEYITQFSKILSREITKIAQSKAIIVPICGGITN